MGDRLCCFNIFEVFVREDSDMCKDLRSLCGNRIMLFVLQHDAHPCAMTANFVVLNQTKAVGRKKT